MGPREMVHRSKKIKRMPLIAAASTPATG
jgi:hypothetical protein